MFPDDLPKDRPTPSARKPVAGRRNVGGPESLFPFRTRMRRSAQASGTRFSRVYRSSPRSVRHARGTPDPVRWPYRHGARAVRRAPRCQPRSKHPAPRAFAPRPEMTGRVPDLGHRAHPAARPGIGEQLLEDVPDENMGFQRRAFRAGRNGRPTEPPGENVCRYAKVVLRESGYPSEAQASSTVSGHRPRPRRLRALPPWEGGGYGTGSALVDRK